MGRPKVTKRKKPGPPRTTGKGELIGVRVLPPLLGRIDSWAENQSSEKITRQEAMRRLIEMGLASAQSSQRPSKRSAAKASNLAGEAIDSLSDSSAPAEEQEKRKRRLLKGPTEFREMRADLPKAKG